MIFLESFHEGKKSELSDMLEKENWKKISQSTLSNTGAVLVSSMEDHFSKAPALHSIIFSKEINLVNVRNLTYYVLIIQIYNFLLYSKIIEYFIFAFL